MTPAPAASSTRSVGTAMTPAVAQPAPAQPPPVVAREPPPVAAREGADEPQEGAAKKVDLG